MNPQAKKIWNSPNGASLFRKILNGDPINDQDNQTLKDLKRADPPQIRHEATPLAGSFTDRTEILCSPSEHGFGPEDTAMIVQHEQGPEYVLIGSRVTDEQLVKLAQRVKTDLADLKAFRDTKREAQDSYGRPDGR